MKTQLIAHDKEVMILPLPRGTFLLLLERMGLSDCLICVLGA